MASTPTGEKCGDGTSGDCHQTLYWCSDCESVLCENCWDVQPTHKPGAGIGARAKKRKHERTELAVADYILSVLEPELSEDKIKESHVSNVQTRWFGIQIDESRPIQVSLKSKPFLELASGPERDPSSQYPCLVSFIGETGAGKSTLINAMMKSVGAAHIRETTPVIGTKIDSPTSGDVHLFQDPKTFSTSRPLFFADCEGFGGGNAAPLAARAKESNHKFKLSHHLHRTSTHKREMNTLEEYNREWAVDELYPRILFTFSDIVCLVSKNFRKIEKHIVDLLIWADKVFERSLNQPMLPKAIIVVNGVDGKKNDNEDWWDVDKVTNKQLEHHRDRINLYGETSGPGSTAASTPTAHDKIARLAEQWRTERGKTISSLNDLILCYYSDFKIICIPSADDPPHIINRQYTKLGELITTGARDSENARKLAGLLMTSEDLDYYLEQGFDHFSASKLPFNFLQAAIQAKPVSIKFSDHLLRTARTLLSQRPNASGTCLLEKLAPIIASSIFLDVIRRGIPYKGNLTHIYDEIYSRHCEISQGELYQKYWRCEEKDEKGKRCVNHQNGHTKGHQDDTGRVFRVGNFWAGDQLDSMDQIESHSQNIKTHLQRIFSDWEKKLVGTGGFMGVKRAALDFHLEQTSMPYGHSQADISPKLTSHTTCCCCLISVPSHPLFCGHVICQECLECYAVKELNNFKLSGCPLHRGSKWTSPWRTNFSPPTAGLRILSLDGGGVRSIVQLTILKELENFIDLGPSVNIVDFFDLIIGTSGGGIAAAGLGIKRFTTQECIEKFQQVSKQAFTKRPFVSVPVFGRFVQAKHHSTYKTTNLEEALRKAFGEKTILFGGQQDPTEEPLARVGVSTITSNNRPFLLANYHRPQPSYSQVGRTGYSFFRGETAEQELMVWEALRATSAAPSYFKSFYHQASGHTFDDGGIMYNNPVVLANTERKIIWPEQKEKDPDILLSIGTLWSEENRSHQEPMTGTGKENSGISQYAMRMLTIAANAIKNDLDCEKTWSSFYDSLNIAEEDEYRKKKYCRINPKMSNAPPALDSVSSMDELQAIARKYCSTSPEMKNVASMLIASLFYFELKNAEESPGVWTCEGEILCRLPANSHSLKTLCNRLHKKHEIGGNQSWFYIISAHNPRRHLRKFLRSALKAYEEVSVGGSFCLPVTFKTNQLDALCQIYISLDGPKDEGFLISGFPRNPLKDKTWFRYRNFLADKQGDRENDSGISRSNSSRSLNRLIRPKKDGGILRPNTRWDPGDNINDELARLTTR